MNADDYPIAVAVDAQGNSYVTGTSTGLGVGPLRMTTVKYSSTGEQLWVVQANDSTRSTNIAVDNAGSVYVTGVHYNVNTDYDYLTIRYDAATGEQTWVQSYNGPPGGTDYTRAIALDNAGGVYVTGESFLEASNYDYTTIRYDATTGEETWVRRYNGPDNGDDRAVAIAVDYAGGVYVTGASFGTGTSYNYATIRYDASTGDEVWARRYNGPASGEDRPTDITIDNAGGIYVTGWSSDSEDAADYATIRYEATTGVQAWAQRYDGPASGSDAATAIATDNAGGIYVTGWSYGNNESEDYATIRYEATTGEQVWVQRYDESDFSEDWATAIAVDNLGGVYVTGTSGECVQCYHFTTVRYHAATGEEVWRQQYAFSEDNHAVDMALDRESNLIIIGSGATYETSSDFITIKYSQQGLCTELSEAAITGEATAAVSAKAFVYSLPASGATSFNWSITDSDGTAYTNFTGQGTGSISVNWPAEPGAYKISVDYAAATGCSTSTATRYVHVYDPAAGFVTGGGWSDSPAYPDYALMQSTGKVYWGFAAKYREEEENQVQGSILLLLDTGSSVFRGTGVEDGSLVISGNKAFFRGHGTLTRLRGLTTRTDERRFGFLVAATDGQLGPDTGSDKLRLKIWAIRDDGTEGTVVYDNQVPCPSANQDDNAPACPEIDRGAIVIHKPNAKQFTYEHSLSAGVMLGADGLEVYPTSVSDRATVSFSLEGGGNYTLELYDMKGALVRRLAAGSAEAGKRYEHAFTVEDISRGLYLARLTTASKVQAVKLVVQR